MVLLNSTVLAILTAYPSGFTTSTIAYTEIRRPMNAVQNPASASDLNHGGSDLRTALSDAEFSKKCS
jgi:hypothetical protein